MTEIEQERERYESRLKAQRDARWLARQPEIMLQEGLEKGRAEGRAEGLLQGRWIATVQLCQRWLGRPVTPEDELLALPQEALKQLAEQLTMEVSAAPKGREQLQAYFTSSFSV